MSTATSAPLLVTPAWLHQVMTEPKPDTKLTVLDATWVMPGSPRVPSEEHVSKRIPGAKFLGLDEVASPNELGLKHMMPSERTFADACENFGIEPDSHVVIYDSHGIFSSPRALFMFRTFGHTNSSVLDGGLPRWVAEGYMTESGPPAEVPKSVYPTPTLDESVIKSYEQMLANASNTDPSADIVLDARPRGRFLGIDREPRPGLPSGHMPNSFSLTFNLVLQRNTTPDTSTSYSTFLPPQSIRQAVIEAVGGDNAELIIKGEKPVTTTCGSGMTAGAVWLGLKLLGVEKIGFYDESWTGYAARENSLIEKST